MGAETINAIKEALTPLAEKIGVGAGHTWDIVVQGQIAEGWAYLMLGAFVLSLMIGWFIFAYNIYKKYPGEGYVDSSNRETVGIVSFFVIMLGGFIFAMCLYSGIFHIMAPEYKAIEFFIEAVKPDND